MQQVRSPLESKLRQAVMNMKENLILTFGSTQRAIQQVDNIRDGLIAADPEGKDTYTANLKPTSVAQSLRC